MSAEIRGCVIVKITHDRPIAFRIPPTTSTGYKVPECMVRIVDPHQHRVTEPQEGDDEQVVLSKCYGASEAWIIVRLGRCVTMS